MGMDFEYLIKQHNLKVTPQRLSILTSMHKYGHIGIDDLYIEVRKYFSTISLATLYKNINLMLKNSLITEVKIPSIKSKYEIKKEAHAHVFCTVCKEFEDVAFDYKSIITKVEKNTAYKVDASEFVFSGICQNCQ